MTLHFQILIGFGIILTLAFTFIIYKIATAKSRSELFREKVKFLPKNPKRNIGSLNPENEYKPTIERYL